MLGNMLNDLAEAIRRWTEKISGEYMVLDRRASSRCTLGLDRCVPLFGPIVHWMMLL